MSQTLLVFSVLLVLSVFGLLVMAWYIYRENSKTIDEMAYVVREKTIDRNRIAAKTAVLETDKIKLQKLRSQDHAKIQSLDEEKTRLTEQLDISQRKVERWRHQFSNLEDNYNKVKLEIESLFRHNEELLADNAELIDGNESLLEGRRKSLEKQGAPRPEQDVLEQTIPARKREVLRLAKKNRRLQKLAEDRRQTVEKLTKKLNASLTAEELLAEDYQASLAERDKLQTEIKKLLDLRDQLLDDQDQLSKANEKLQSDNKFLQTQVESLEDRQQQIKTDSQLLLIDVEKAQRLNERLRTEYNEVKAKQQALIAEKEQVSAENKKLLQDNESFLAEISQLNEERDRWSESQRELEKRVQTSLTEFKNLEHTKNLWERQRTDLHKDLAGERESRIELQTKLTELLGELKSLQKAYEKSQEEFSNLQKWVKGLELQRAEKEKLEESFLREATRRVVDEPTLDPKPESLTKHNTSSQETGADQAYEKRLRKRLMKAHAYVLKLEKQNIGLKRKLKAIKRQSEGSDHNCTPGEESASDATASAQIIEFQKVDES